MKIKIKNRFTLEVMFEVEAACLGSAVSEVVADNPSANLSFADLSFADLSFADLRSANLRKANLRKANLRKANLSEANLSEANLSFANLSEANLRKANLRKANLSFADLSFADLRSANLSEANLWNCIGNMSQVKSAQLCKYMIAWTAEYIQIGCKRFKIHEWFQFDDAAISEMDCGALDWWRENKEFVRLMVNKNPAEKTGHEQNDCN